MFPYPKSRKIQKGYLDLPNIECFGEQAICNFAKEYLRHFIENEISVEQEAKANVLLLRKSDLPQNGYVLTVEDVCRIEYADKGGLHNALTTLIQLLEIRDGKQVIQRQTIFDYSDCHYRSVMIDLARGLPDFQRLKEDIKILSSAKCNKLHLHLADELGLCYISNVYPNAENIRGTKLYSKAMLKELVVYCETLGIEVIPEIEIPAHATHLLQNAPTLKCKKEEENQSFWTVCAGSEETYRFYEVLLGEICEIFPSQYVHIGGDEHYFADVPSLNRKRYWADCEVCRNKMQEENLRDETELFYYLIFRIHAILKKLGKRLMLWNDALDVSKPVDIPKDCVVQFWRIANEYRGPREGCTYRKLLEQGFKVVSSPFEYCYVNKEDYATPEKTASFSYRHYGDSVGYEKQVIGCEACAWEYGNPKYTHYPYSFLPSTVLLLAKMWDDKNAVYDKEYRRNLTKLILGWDIPSDYDLFELFGSIMPPRINGKPSYVSIENQLIDRDTLEYHKRILQGVKHTYSPFYRDKIVELIEEMRKK